MHFAKQFIILNYLECDRHAVLISSYLGGSKDNGLHHKAQPIGAIGIDLGFDEPTNFVKFFKREAVMVPMAFRQLYTEPSR